MKVGRRGELEDEKVARRFPGCSFYLTWERRKLLQCNNG